MLEKTLQYWASFEWCEKKPAVLGEFWTMLEKKTAVLGELWTMLEKTCSTGRGLVKDHKILYYLSGFAFNPPNPTVHIPRHSYVKNAFLLVKDGFNQ